MVRIALIAAILLSVAVAASLPARSYPLFLKGITPVLPAVYLWLLIVLFVFESLEC